MRKVVKDSAMPSLLRSMKFVRAITVTQNLFLLPKLTSLIDSFS